MFFVPAVASMKRPILISLTSTNSSNSNATNYTHSAQSFGVADPTREIFVAISRGRFGSELITGVTIGGITAVVESPDSSSSIAYAHVPTGTSGDIVVTGDGGLIRQGICAYRVVNRKVIGATFVNTGVIAPVSSTSFTVDIPTPASGFVLGVLTKTTSSVTTVTGEVTEDFQFSESGAEPGSGTFVRSAIQTVATDITCSGTWTGNASYGFRGWSFS